MNIASHLLSRRRRLSRLGLLLLADIVVFAGTDARKVNAILLIIGFGLLVATLYWLVYGGLSFIRLYGIVVKQKRRLAGSLTGLVACIVALQSVGELNIKDVLLLLPLVAIGYIYTAYGLNQRPTD